MMELSEALDIVRSQKARLRALEKIEEVLTLAAEAEARARDANANVKNLDEAAQMIEADVISQRQTFERERTDLQQANARLAAEHNEQIATLKAEREQAAAGHKKALARLALSRERAEADHKAALDKIEEEGQAKAAELKALNEDLERLRARILGPAVPAAPAAPAPEA